MKFGIYSSIANPPRGEDLPRCVDEVIEEAQLAEQAGFDSYTVILSTTTGKQPAKAVFCPRR